MKLGKIMIAAVGKLKKEHWRAAQTDYVKRLRRYTGFSLVEVRDSVGKGSSDNIAITKEGDALLDATKLANFRIALSIQGQQMDSMDFAHNLLQWIEKYGNIAFMIGGPIGLSSDVLRASQYDLSLSAFTLPHELARIVLLEQLYRSATIINKHQYHK